MDLHEVLRAAADICEPELRQAELVLTTRLARAPLWVVGDRMRLQQVFWNLLRNAANHAPRTGEVELRSDHDGDEVVVEVRDSGPGMAADQVDTLFEAFEQAGEAGTGHGGLGLGLSIARGFVHGHGGTIRARPAEGGGLLMEVRLPAGEAPDETAQEKEAAQGARSDAEARPVAHPPRSEGADEPSPAEERARPVTVLLVEDHADTATLLSMLLESVGYHVLTAHGVATALDLAGDDVDVLVSDLGLPDGTGYELLRRVHERVSVPAIALTGFATADDVERCRAAGFSTHVRKPASVETLSEAIERARAAHGRSSRKA